MAESVSYRLSVIDQSAVRTYMRCCYCYPHQHGKVAVEDIVTKLTSSIQQAVNRYPILAGTLSAEPESLAFPQPDFRQTPRRETISIASGFGPSLEARRESTGGNTFALLQIREQGNETATEGVVRERIRVLVMPDGKAVLPVVKHFKTVDFATSYREMVSREMPPAVLFEGDFMPPPESSETSTEGIPVFAVHASFVDGGVFVAILLHHAVGDEHDLANVIRAMSSDQAFCSPSIRIDATEQSRSRDRLSGSRGIKPRPLESLSSLRTRLPSNESRLPSSFSRHVLAFDLQKILLITDMIDERVRLGLNEPYEKISAFECLVSILWRAIARARSHKIKVEEKQSSTCILSVNMRMRLEPPLGSEYFGNAFMVTKVSARSLRLSLPIDVGTLSSTARLVHERSASTTEVDLRAFIAATNNASDFHDAAIAGINWNTDVAVTDWSRLPVGKDASLGLGLGPAQFLRAASKEQAGHCCTVLPQKPEEGIWEVLVQTDRPTMASLVEDVGLMPFILHVA